jgi:hypothetical protein
MSKLLLSPEQTAALKALRDRQFKNMSELHDARPPRLNFRIAIAIGSGKSAAGLPKIKVSD